MYNYFYAINELYMYLIKETMLLSNSFITYTLDCCMLCIFKFENFDNRENKYLLYILK